MPLRFSESEYSAFKAGKAFGGTSKRRKGKMSAAIKAGTITPHRAALIQLGKNPSLRSGNEEHYLQVEVFDHIHEFHPDIYPYLASYPAGGMRSKKAASQIQAEGQKAGYPDIILDAPRGRYHGGRFELKTMKGSLQESQKSKLRELSEQGYYCTAVKGKEAMVNAIVAYWNLSKGEELAQSELDKKWVAH